MENNKMFYKLWQQIFGVRKSIANCEKIWVRSKTLQQIFFYTYGIKLNSEEAAGGAQF